MDDMGGHAERRAVGYWFVDGLPEVAFGAILLATALVFGAATAAGGEASGLILAVGLVLAIVGGIPLAGRWVRRRKRSSTYPRTGRVKYRGRGPARRAVSWGIGGLLAVALVLVTWREGSSTVLAVAVTGVLVAALVFVALRTGLRRFAATAIVAVILLAAASELLPDVQAVMGTVFAGTGLLLLRNGWAARTRYLRSTSECLTEGEES